MPYQQQPVVPYAPVRRQNSTATAALVFGIGAPLICGMTAPLLWGLDVPALFWLGRFPPWCSGTRRAVRSVAPVSRAMGRPWRA